MKITLVIIFCSLAVLSYGQKDKNPNQVIDLEAFNEKANIVEWLYAYDLVAWRTTDSMMLQDPEELKQLGAEWFCFQDREDTCWHAFYGKFENDAYNLVIHYILDKNGAVSRTKDAMDKSFLDKHARALVTASNETKKVFKGGNTPPIFNQFIRQNEDKSFSVWILPAFQPDNTAAYGGEFFYKINAQGDKILEKESYFNGKIYGFKVDTPREITLDYTDVEQPTLGSIFFVWYYKEHFTRIIISNKKSVSTVIQTESNKMSNPPWMWVHAIKESKKGKKKKE